MFWYSEADILDCGYILHHGVAGNNFLQGFMSCLSHHPPRLLQDFWYKTLEVNAIAVENKTENKLFLCVCIYVYIDSIEGLTFLDKSSKIVKTILKHSYWIELGSWSVSFNCPLFVCFYFVVLNVLFLLKGCMVARLRKTITGTWNWAYRFCGKCCKV